jgi:hypothetical protein
MTAPRANIYAVAERAGDPRELRVPLARDGRRLWRIGPRLLTIVTPR